MDINKTDFMKCFIDAYTSKMLSTNISLHAEFYKTIQNIHKSKKDDDIMKAYWGFKYIYNNNAISLIPTDLDVKLSSEELATITNMFNEENSSLVPLKQVVSNKVYALLNYVYINLIRQTNLAEILGCVSFLLALKKKDIYKQEKNNNIEAIDLIFNIVTHIANIISNSVYKYVMISKELMYFKTNKKNLLDRVRLLQGCIYVIFHKSISLTKLNRPSASCASDKHMYLYCICNKDEDQEREMEHSMRRQRNSERPKPKSLMLSDKIYQVPKPINIVKMSS
jgi:hypothetical protein